MRNHPALGCTRCPLGEVQIDEKGEEYRRTQVVWGEGNPKADIMIVGEAPGYYEDISGRPFVGRAGKRLNALLGLAGLEREGVYISNLVKCRPAANRRPRPREVETCQDWLDLELGTVAAKVVVLMGKTSTWLAFPHEQKKVPAGQARVMEGRIYIATYHPSAAMRSSGTPDGALDKAIVRDLRRAKRYAI